MRTDGVLGLSFALAHPRPPDPAKAKGAAYHRERTKCGTLSLEAVHSQNAVTTPELPAPANCAKWGFWCCGRFVKGAPFGGGGKPQLIVALPLRIKRLQCCRDIGRIAGNAIYPR